MYKKNVRIIDPDTGNTLPSAKRIRVYQDVSQKVKCQKVKCLKYLLKCYEKIHIEVSAKRDENHMSITLANQITNIMFAAFTTLRQRSNGAISQVELISRKKNLFTANFGGLKSTITWEKTLKIMEDEATALGLQFIARQSEAENWYGTAVQYLTFFIGNDSRLGELRLGHSLFTTRDAVGETVAFPVTKYGIQRKHRVLMEGSSYHPSRRVALAQSVGPLTALILHIRTKYPDKERWTNASKRMMSHVPYIEQVLQAVSYMDSSEVSYLVQIIGDILFMATNRQPHRIFFPINMLYRVWDEEESVMAADEPSGSDVIPTGGDEILRHFNISGHGGFYVYNKASKFDFSLDGDFQESYAQQILFHAIMGTYCEDISILEQITTLTRWNTREDMGSCLKLMGTCGKVAVFKPIKLIYYSIRSGANQPGFLASTYYQQSIIPVFSGKRVQRFTDEFFESFDKNHRRCESQKTVAELMSSK